MVNIVQFGVGNVGNELVNQVGELNSAEIRYVSIGNSKISKIDIRGLDLGGGDFQNLAAPGTTADWSKVFDKVGDLDNVVMVDVTAQDWIEPHLEALSRGWKIVLANKKPLVKEWSVSKVLFNNNDVRFEATVGAGLPIIQTLKGIIESGDEVKEINGAFSGTLGYITTELHEGKSFSEALASAIKKGYTEPNPLDDLDGMDVARKALILSRLIGREENMEDLKVNGLVNRRKYENLETREFIKISKDLDGEFKVKVKDVEDSNKVLKFVAHIGKKTLINLSSIEAKSSLGQLKGVNNLAEITTSHYSDDPLVISGPGAGKEVTANGVLRDILSFVQ
ncbi:MAG TPA: hypothetical protein ENI23_13490 [bacterium]|nr:hypothetical protein [bacterium]